MTDSNGRMPPIPRGQMDDAQRAAADELVAGPREGVKGPFIPLLRSPGLLVAHTPTEPGAAVDPLPPLPR